MFAIHDFPVNIEKEEFSISVIPKDGNYLYERSSKAEKVKKFIITKNKKLLINPVEPLNTPKHLTPYLFIQFDTPLMIEPKSKKNIFITFPIEIGIFVIKEKEFHVIDIFSLSRQKFILYGDPRMGLICKHWRSPIYTLLPKTNPLHEGVMELLISNPNPHWIEIKKAIFNAYGMKIYFDREKVSLKAQIKLKNEDLAETEFEGTPIEKGMKNAIEIYTSKRLSVTSTRFIMEFGL